MTVKPSLASDYRDEDLSAVTAGCLYLATKMGDLMENIVVVGGLVPSLLMQHRSAADTDYSSSPFQRHVGTKDLDLGLDPIIMRSERYLELRERLLGADLGPDLKDRERRRRQAWRLRGLRPSRSTS